MIPPKKLESQDYLNKIKICTTEQKMKINENKTKVMIFNFIHNYQFTTRLELNHTNVKVVSEGKLLGTHITNDL